MSNWRAVPGYEGAYEASDLGRIRSITRQVFYGKHGHATYKGRELKLTKLKSGYLTVNLALAGRTRTTYVHDIILKTFVGARPYTEDKSEIRHLDGDKNNNCLANLKYGTVKENAEDRKRHSAERK